jgi:hypothetical protein
MIGEANIIIDDLDKRVDAFIKEVILEQCNKKHPGHAHKAGEASYWILMANDREDLVDKISDEAVRCGSIYQGTDLDMVAREVELFKCYIKRMLEKDCLPQDPYETIPIK